MSKIKHPLIGKTYKTSTDQLLQVKSVDAETVTLKYLNRDKPDVTSTISHVEKVVKLEVWKEVK